MIDLAHAMPDKTRFMDDLVLTAKAKFNILHLHLIDKLGNEIIDQMLNDTKERHGNGPVILKKTSVIFFKGM